MAEQRATIPVWDYRPALGTLRPGLHAALDRVLDSGQLILGAEVAAFEREFALSLGAAHAVGVNSGTDALMLALRAFDVGAAPGHEVVTVANTAVPTAAAIVAAGARPVFCEIDPATDLMDVTRLSEVVTPATRAIVPVHLYGQCVPMGPVLEIAKRHGLVVIEDVAQAAGAFHNGQAAGTFGHAAAFSFYPTKNLGTFGDAGLVATNDEAAARRLRRLRQYGFSSRQYSVEDGWNSRLDELHAAFLRLRLPLLTTEIDERRAIAARYDDALAPLTAHGLRLPVEGQDNRHSYYVYAVHHDRREAVMAALLERGVVTNISYPLALHQMPPFAPYLRPGQTLPLTEAHARSVFSLPMFPGLTMAEQDRVIAAMTEVLAGPLAD
jgi:dTDP-3-amino-2,3,6-trideoxy-4-keto-D-glucose/dTDP-3-amino-3,4,6-trideoxy-alpha-D-glucose/dTDP-2,6-dideoxy-D-kanosamine transaminase